MNLLFSYAGKSILPKFGSNSASFHALPARSSILKLHKFAFFVVPIIGFAFGHYTLWPIFYAVSTNTRSTDKQTMTSPAFVRNTEI